MNFSRNLKKKVISIVIALNMLLTVFPMMSLNVNAQDCQRTTKEAVTNDDYSELRGGMCMLQNHRSLSWRMLRY